jgi:thioredoxin-like negative regulator of GroEL
LDRLLLLVVLTLVLVLLGAAARALARSRSQQARMLPKDEIWQALAAAPDGRPAVVAFSTPSCAACHTAQKPALVHLQERTEGAVRVLEIDAAERPDVARRFGILTVPSTAILDADGRLTAVNNGFTPTQRLVAQLGLKLDAEELAGRKEA